MEPMVAQTVAALGVVQAVDTLVVEAMAIVGSLDVVEVAAGSVALEVVHSYNPAVVVP